MDWRDHPELVPRRNMPPVKLTPIAEPDLPDFLEGEELNEADGYQGVVPRRLEFRRNANTINYLQK